jgi:hypothetical protein
MNNITFADSFVRITSVLQFKDRNYFSLLPVQLKPEESPVRFRRSVYTATRCLKAS